MSGAAPSVALCALIIEALFGYPQPLFAVIGHPATWLGALIGAFEARFNQPSRSGVHRRIAGFLLVAALLCVAIGAGAVLRLAAETLPRPGALLVQAVLASSLLAQRSLYDHVAAVARALETQDIDAGRRAVGMIVGRDTTALDRSAVCRAAIESLAENFSDGIVAPLLWLAVAGLPGVIGYKAINTADSMVGHRTERFESFGYAAAKLDDIVNWPAARLAAGLLIAAALVGNRTSVRQAWRATRRDAAKHLSPNAGWPEAAMAGALGMRLGGPRSYGGRVVDGHWMGDGASAIGPEEVRRALRLYRTACLLQGAILTGIVLLFV